MKKNICKSTPFVEKFILLYYLILKTTTLKAEDYIFPLALSYISGVGCIRAKQIIANLGSAEAFFKEKPKNLRKLPGLSNQKLPNVELHSAVENAEQQIQEAVNDGQQLYYYLDEAYPRRLKQIDDAPIILFGRGNMELNCRRTLGIVGTRNATHYGKQVTEDLIEAIKDKEITVISGLALGIDGVAHQSCVQANVPNIALLGHGLDLIYPYKHKRLAEKIILNGGLLTEFPMLTKPDACNFPMRNRIVAGMVDALVVVESDIKGGSLITCNLANDYGKDVFAVPGPIYSKYSSGCHKVISENKAHVFSSVSEMLKMMNWEEDIRKLPTQLDIFNTMGPEERSVFSFIRDKKQVSIDVLSVVQQMPLGKLSGILLTMEIAGFLKSLPGKRYALNDRFAY